MCEGYRYSPKVLRREFLHSLPLIFNRFLNLFAFFGRTIHQLRATIHQSEYNSNTDQSAHLLMGLPPRLPPRLALATIAARGAALQ